ncbi:MAG: diaminopimelate epimerase [Bacteroidota bacterium]
MAQFPHLELFCALRVIPISTPAHALDKPFVIGDFIVVDSYMGNIEKIGMRLTQILNLSGEMIIFSNIDLLPLGGILSRGCDLPAPERLSGHLRVHPASGNSGSRALNLNGHAFFDGLKAGKPVNCGVMQSIQFTKAEGAQNDFVIVDDRNRTLDDATRRRFTQLISHRRKGAGSDGAIFIDASSTHDFTMSFFNPDGSVGSMCGNGGRCAALYALVNGIAEAHMRFEVLGKSYAASVDGGVVHLAFPPPGRIELGVELETVLGTFRADYIDTGAPHLVLFAEELPGDLRGPLQQIDMHRVGSLLRSHERFAPRGCNVNVLEIAAEGLVHIRTFEKGVEAETEACGTGTIASGFVAHLRRGLQPPVRLRSHGDDILQVHFTPDPTAAHDHPDYFSRDLALLGPAVLVYEGCYTLPENGRA